MKKLAVIPTNTLERYEEKGIASQLETYYNPHHFFDEVYLLSPKENRVRYEYGMKIIPTRPEDLHRRLKELDIDIIRAYGGYWACSMACENKVPGIPVIVSVHDTNPITLFDSIKNADLVFCMSKTVKNFVLKKYKNSNRIWILPNRVDFNTMCYKSEDEISFLNDKYQFKYKILHVGRKTEQKNLDTLIKALRLLGKDYCIITIGKGDIEKYKRIAIKETVIDQCIFIESVKNEDLPCYYSWADCMCTPSRWEGFGIVFIEALACKAIVITSDIGPMNEFIKHQHNGLLVKNYENPKALAEMINLACTNKELRNKIKKNARLSVKKFKKSKINAMEVNYYNKILEMKTNQVFKLSILYRYLTIIRLLFRKLNILFEYILSLTLNWKFFKNFDKLYLLQDYVKKAEFFSPGIKYLILILLNKYVLKK